MLRITRIFTSIDSLLKIIRIAHFGAIHDDEQKINGDSILSVVLPESSTLSITLWVRYFSILLTGIHQAFTRQYIHNNSWDSRSGYSHTALSSYICPLRDTRFNHLEPFFALSYCHHNIFCNQPFTRIFAIIIAMSIAAALIQWRVMQLGHCTYISTALGTYRRG